MIESALRVAGVSSRDVSYVEAHGTGTALGDPIEVNALKRAFSACDEGVLAKQYCALSAVKSNIGHLESASGMAGMIKVILAMRHGVIPGVQHFSELNPYIEIEDSPFYVADKNVVWEVDGLRTAGVSSFGMGGVNAHVVLQEYKGEAVASGRDDAKPGVCFVGLSAKGADALRRQATDLLRWLRGNEGCRDLEAIGYTLNVGREHFGHRLAVVFEDRQQLCQLLALYVDGKEGQGVYEGVVDKGKVPEGMMEDGVKEQELALHWVRGGAVGWDQLYKGQVIQRIGLPGYPFEKRRCWFSEEGLSVKKEGGKNVLPVCIDDFYRDEGEAFFSKGLSVGDFFVRDHVVQGDPVLPGVVYLEMLLEGLYEWFGRRGNVVMHDFCWQVPFWVKNEGVLKWSLSKEVNGVCKGVFVNEEGQECASGGVAFGQKADGLERLPLERIRQSCDRKVLLGQELYERFKGYGLRYGGAFQCLKEVYDGEGEALGRIELSKDLIDEQKDYMLHPGLMDATFQTVVALTLEGQSHGDEQHVPFMLRRMEVFCALGSVCYAHVRWKRSSKGVAG